MVARFYVGLIGVLSIFLAQQDYKSGYVLMAYAYGSVAVLGPVSIILSCKVPRLVNMPAYLAVGFTFVIFVIGAFTQFDSSAHLIWIPISPILFFYLTNVRIGMVLTFFSYIALVVGYESFPGLMNRAPVPVDDFYQVNTAYFLAAVLSYFYEADRARQEQKLFRQSEYDFLTKIFNRRGISRVLESQFDQFKRYNIPFSIIICDLDNFKQVNDQHGHGVGDLVLIEMVGMIEKSLRSVDIIGRWGGEEFIVVANATSGSDAARLAEKLRQVVEQHEFAVVNRLTASFGVAGALQGDSIETLFRRADMALYKAKKTKNKVDVYMNS